MTNEELMSILNDIIVKNLGHATAYGYAKSKGYEGTEEEFAEFMADYAHVAQDAEASAAAAKESEDNAKVSETNAKTSEDNAKESEDNAKVSETNADESETNAKQSELNADAYAKQSESWAVGTVNGSPVGQMHPAYHNNSKYYAEQAGTKAQEAATSAATATQKASEASQSETVATQKASEASSSAAEAKTSEDNAKLSENTASNAAVSALNSRDSAAESATTASGAATTATQKATEAGESATTASGAATTATQKATEASQSATSASGSASTATQKATEASNSASAAAQSAAEAEEAATHVADMALMQAIAPKYDATIAYKAGALFTYQGMQYYCIADAPAGTLPTNTTYFEEKSVADIIEMIKNGSIVTGHSEVADNLTPYSEDSGAIQDAPFISQGTGTNNNTDIVTTGNIAKQLEKQGNTIHVMQLLGGARTKEGVTATYDSTKNTYSLSGTSTRTYAGVHSARTFIKGHKYYFRLKVLKNPNNIDIYLGALNAGMSTNNSNVFTMTQNTAESAVGISNFASNTDMTGIEYEAVIFDITSWNADIITDLTSHPEHFSWYYNGSLAYDAGSLQNCNGRYLECGQWRQLWDEEWEVGGIDDNGNPIISGSIIRSKNYTLIIPNRAYYSHIGTSGANMRVFFYDKDKRFISYYDRRGGGVFESPSNAVYIKFRMNTVYGATYKNDITISLYYTPAEGGEGYDQYYPYVAPIRIDTGNEQLRSVGSVKDVKLPSGVIRKLINDTNSLVFEIFGEGGENVYRANISDRALTKNVLCAKYFNNKNVSAANDLNDKEMFVSTGSTYIYVKDSSGVPTGTFYYELAEPTTEQGTPFSEYAPINDYSYMAWFDTDGNLVSIPQGLKIQYSVNYKGFLDDLNARTNGDAGAVVIEDEFTDEALNARGYYKMVDMEATQTEVNAVVSTLIDF